ncbi:MAG TPA: hypothetical protein VE398_16335, partial [Acidobacteriota bacterium]|nr:hypothetical protein [Acidobacteriota bacterium]
AQKARASADLFLKRLEKLEIGYREVHTSIFGCDAVHGSMSHEVENPNEVYLRMAFLVDEAETADRISHEMVTHVLCGIPTSCMLEVGRPAAHRQIIFWPSLIPKSAVRPCVEIRGGTV